jgi:hypothetical protein
MATDDRRPAGFLIMRTWEGQEKDASMFLQWFFFYASTSAPTQTCDRNKPHPHGYSGAPPSLVFAPPWLRQDFRHPQATVDTHPAACDHRRRTPSPLQ